MFFHSVCVSKKNVLSCAATFTKTPILLSSIRSLNLENSAFLSSNNSLFDRTK